MRTGWLKLSILSAYVEHLPPGSAIWAIEHGLPFGWTLTDVLISDLFAVTAGEIHPARAEIDSTARARSALARLRKQRERLKHNP